MLKHHIQISVEVLADLQRAVETEDWRLVKQAAQTLRPLARFSLTLGGGRSHVYVTRAAVLDAWKLLPAAQGFEEVRRELSHLLLDALPVPGDRRRWTFDAYAKRFVAYVVPDGDLLVVGSVSLAQDAPDAYSSDPPAEDRVARWDKFLRDGGMSEALVEIRILRAALHGMASDWLAGHHPESYVFQDTQSYVDYYVAKERTK